LAEACFESIEEHALGGQLLQTVMPERRAAREIYLGGAGDEAGRSRRTDVPLGELERGSGADLDFEAWIGGAARALGTRDEEQLEARRSVGGHPDQGTVGREQVIEKRQPLVGSSDHRAGLARGERCEGQSAGGGELGSEAPVEENKASEARDRRRQGRRRRSSWCGRKAQLLK